MKKFFEDIREYFADVKDCFELAVVDGKLAELEMEPDEVGSRKVLRELYESSRDDILARIEARRRRQQGALAN